MRTDVAEKRLAIVDETDAKAPPYPDAHPHAPLCIPAPGVTLNEGLPVAGPLPAH